MLREEFRRFAAVGAIGFVVDGALLQLLVSAAGWSPLTARLVSFPVALTVTFLLNRRWTFGRHQAPRALQSYGAYTVVQIAGALINLAVFSACVATVAAMREWPLVPLAIGAGVALVFNFFASRWFAFR